MFFLCGLLLGVFIATTTWLMFWPLSPRMRQQHRAETSELCREIDRLEKELEAERSEKQTIVTAHAAAEADALRLRKLLIEIGERINAELES